jgi:excinuclease UvrABC nuclease subunit
MKDDESIHDFHMNVLEIANSSSALGEKMSEEKMVRKILRSLPKKFDMKVTTIEEAQDISTMRVDELIGSLQTFELGIIDKYEKKNKSITFVSNTEDEEDQCDLDIDEEMINAIVLLGRQFNKMLKRIDRKSRPNVKNIPSDISKNSDS